MGGIDTAAILSVISLGSRIAFAEVAFLIENKPFQLELFNTAAKLGFAKYNDIQSTVDYYTKPGNSDYPMLVEFVEQNLSCKCKINCLGFALVVILLSEANNVEYKVFASETHCWVISTSNMKIIDVSSNLKLSSKCKLPLSIYANAAEIDAFDLCLLIIINENSLEEEEEYSILYALRDKLKHPWELAKLCELSAKLNTEYAAVSYSMIQSQTQSMVCLITSAIYCIKYLHQADQALTHMNQMIVCVTKLCTTYTMNSDIFIDDSGSFIDVATEFCNEFKGSGDHLAEYEDWVGRSVEVVDIYMPELSTKFRKIIPTLSGKRRRGW